METSMKITLVQTEIELAIREWVGRQLKVADGMSMDIELAATRAGGTGFTATIDIISEVKQVQAAQPKTMAALGASVFNGPVGPSETTVFPSSVKATDTKTNQEPEKASEPAPASEPENPLFDTSENVADTRESTATAQQDKAPAPAPSASRSLFGGLKKPTN